MNANTSNYTQELISSDVVTSQEAVNSHQKKSQVYLSNSMSTHSFRQMFTTGTRIQYICTHTSVMTVYTHTLKFTGEPYVSTIQQSIIS